MASLEHVAQKSVECNAMEYTRLSTNVWNIQVACVLASAGGEHSRTQGVACALQSQASTLQPHDTQHFYHNVYDNIMMQMGTYC